MLKKFFEKQIEKSFIRRIIKEDEKGGCLKGLGLNSIRSEAAALCIAGKMDMDFYEKVFSGSTLSKGYWIVNHDYIYSYLEKNKKTIDKLNKR